MHEPVQSIQANLTGRVSRPTGPPATFPAASGSLAYVIALCSVAAIGGFLFGFDSGVINGAVDALAHAFGTRAAATGFAVASVLLGCAVGAFGAGTLADRLGRRPTMLLNAGLFLASAVVTGAAGSAGLFIAARHRGRAGYRRRQRAGAHVHFGGGPGACARPTGLAAANGDCAGAVRRLPEQ